MSPKINPFQPSTSPWDQSFTAGSAKGTIIFPSAVPPYASSLVPIVQHTAYNVAGLNSPPAQPSFWQATTIQLTMNGVNGGVTFTDQRFATAASTVTHVTTNNGAFKFGGSAALGDGVSASGTGIVYAASPKWEFGANNFTIEGWFNTSQAQQYTILCAHSDSGFSAGAWILLINNGTANDGLVAFWERDFSAVAGMLIGTAKHADGLWHHVAVVRAASTWTLYVDGVQEATVNFVPAVTASTLDLSFAGGHFFNRTLSGYLNMWRIVNGIAVYTGTNFALPTAPFPTS